MVCGTRLQLQVYQLSTILDKHMGRPSVFPCPSPCSKGQGGRVTSLDESLGRIPGMPGGCDYQGVDILGMTVCLHSLRDNNCRIAAEEVGTAVAKDRCAHYSESNCISECTDFNREITFIKDTRNKSFALVTCTCT